MSYVQFNNYFQKHIFGKDNTFFLSGEPTIKKDKQENIVEKQEPVILKIGNKGKKFNPHKKDISPDDII